MLPVLFSIGSVSVSSFGVFLALAFLFAVFLIWRLARAWDLDEEKILDLTLLTFLGGLVFARIYFVIEHLQFFLTSPLKIILVTKFPGFSFWGAFLGGWLTLYFFAKKFKMDFVALADIGAVGFLGGLILSDIGCYLGGCNIGIVSNLFFATNVSGVIGKRFPISALEAIFLSLGLLKIWPKATHFHAKGQILSLSLIYIGIVKFLTELLRQVHDGGYLFSATLIVLGTVIFYKIQAGKRTPISDIKSLVSFAVSLLKDNQTRNLAILHLKKSWYNQKTKILWSLRNLNKLLRRLRVKPTP